MKRKPFNTKRNFRKHPKKNMKDAKKAIKILKKLERNIEFKSIPYDDFLTSTNQGAHILVGDTITASDVLIQGVDEDERIGNEVYVHSIVFNLLFWWFEDETYSSDDKMPSQSIRFIIYRKLTEEYDVDKDDNLWGNTDGDYDLLANAYISSFYNNKKEVRGYRQILFDKTFKQTRQTDLSKSGYQDYYHDPKGPFFIKFKNPLKWSYTSSSGYTQKNEICFAWIGTTNQLTPATATIDMAQLEWRIKYVDP